LTISGSGYVQENQVSQGGPLGTIRFTAGSTYSGPITLSGNASFVGLNAAATVTGTIGETGGAQVLTVGGSNLNSTTTLNLNPTVPSTYTGGTIIDHAIVTASSSGAFGTGTVTLQTTGTVFTAAVSRLILADIVNIANSVTPAGPSITGAGGNGILQGPGGTGMATFSGPLTINANATAGGHFNGGNTTAGLVLSGPITATVPLLHRLNRVVYSGSGSTFSPVLTSRTPNLFLNQGTAAIGATNGLATNAVVDVASSAAAIFDLNDFNQDIAGVIRTTGNAATVTNSSANIRTLTLNVPATFAQSYPGTIAGNLQLDKSGSGSHAISGPNTYVGGTTITAGTLVANGAIANSATGTAAVTVTGGTLAGTGRIAGSITFSGGTITPGDAANTGVLTTAQVLTIPMINPTGTLSFNLTGGLANSSQLNITAAGLDLGTAYTLNVTSFAGATDPEFFTIIASTGSSVSGTFAGLPEGSTVFTNTGTGTNYVIKYGTFVDIMMVAQPGNVVLTIAPVPEPMMLIGLATLALLVRRRR